MIWSEIKIVKKEIGSYWNVISQSRAEIYKLCFFQRGCYYLKLGKIFHFATKINLAYRIIPNIRVHVCISSLPKFITKFTMLCEMN